MPAWTASRPPAGSYATAFDRRSWCSRPTALDEYVYEALRAGAAGFLLKMDSPPRVVEAVRLVAAGDALLAP